MNMRFTMKDYENELESCWNEKFGSPAVEVTAVKDYTDTPEGVERATIFKLKNGKYVFVKEYSPDDNYGYGEAVIRRNLTKEQAEELMRKYISKHEKRENKFDSLIQEILNDFVKLG